MIVPPIDHHIAAHRHVAGNTRYRWTRIVVAVGDCLIFYRRMTLEADTALWRTQLATMRIMTVAAGDAFRKHLALFERAVIVGFFIVTHLAIGRKGRAIKQRDLVRVGQPSTRYPVFRQLATSRMAAAAGLDLFA